MAEEIKTPMDKQGNYDAYKKGGKQHVDFGGSELEDYPASSSEPFGEQSNVVDIEE